MSCRAELAPRPPSGSLRETSSMRISRSVTGAAPAAQRVHHKTRIDACSINWVRRLGGREAMHFAMQAPCESSCVQHGETGLPLAKPTPHALRGPKCIATCQSDRLFKLHSQKLTDGVDKGAPVPARWSGLTIKAWPSARKSRRKALASAVQSTSPTAPPSKWSGSAQYPVNAAASAAAQPRLACGRPAGRSWGLGVCGILLVVDSLVLPPGIPGEHLLLLLPASRLAPGAAHSGACSLPAAVPCDASDPALTLSMCSANASRAHAKRSMSRASRASRAMHGPRNARSRSP